MQHHTGTDLHRSSKFRRNKATKKVHADADIERNDFSKPKKGRKFTEDSESDYLLYAGSIIQLLKEKGYCNFYEIKTYPHLFRFKREGDDWLIDFYKYPPLKAERPKFHLSDKKLEEKLIQSGFHLQLLAICAIELAHINLESKRLKIDQIEKCKKILAKEMSLSVDSPEVHREAMKEFVAKMLKVSVNHAKVKGVMKEYDKNPNAKWFKEWIKDKLPDLAHEEFNEVFFGLDPKGNKTVLYSGDYIDKKDHTNVCEIRDMSSKGATPQQLLGLSKQMVSYWRRKKKNEYKQCKEFIKKLIGRILPKHPYYSGTTFTLPTLSERLDKETIRGFSLES